MSELILTLWCGAIQTGRFPQCTMVFNTLVNGNEYHFIIMVESIQSNRQKLTRQWDHGTTVSYRFTDGRNCGTATLTQITRQFSRRSITHFSFN